MAISSMQLGCSFLFVEGPPSQGKSKPFESLDVCNENSSAPAVDVAVGSFIGAGGVLLPVATQSSGGNIWLGSALVLTGVSFASAFWGFHTRSKCQAYLRKYSAPPNPSAVQAVTQTSPPTVGGSPR
jgi:hypothetical protein